LRKWKDTDKIEPRINSNERFFEDFVFVNYEHMITKKVDLTIDEFEVVWHINWRCILEKFVFKRISWRK
jgi:hypothetical protein